MRAQEGLRPPFKLTKSSQQDKKTAYSLNLLPTDEATDDNVLKLDLKDYYIYLDRIDRVS